MKLAANTITRQLFFSLGILVAGIIIISALALFFLWKTRSVDKISQDIDSQQVLITQLIKTDIEFLTFETVNQEFFRTSKSTLLQQRDSISSAIKQKNEALHQAMFVNSFQIEEQFARIDSAVKAYNDTFEALRQAIQLRGFKDYGMEGKMRVFAHRLETARSTLPLSALLSLRRHEKDFMLRKENKYIKQFNQLAEKLLLSLVPGDSTIIYLTSYQKIFNELTAVEIEIGISPTQGLTGKLSRQAKFISGRLNLLTKLSTQRADKMIMGSAIFFSCISLITIIACTVLTYYTSMRLAHPIKRLSASMGKFIVNEGLNEKELEGKTSDEISNLSQSFIKLTRKLKAQFTEIQQKSSLLEKQNHELKKLNEELDRFIYSAAHDLKSPLTSLDGLVRLAEMEIKSPENAHYFKMMLESIQKLYGFIFDITDYAKNKRQSLKIEKVDLDKSIRDIVQSLRFLPMSHRIKLSINIQQGEIYTDKTRLEIILKNIISNSYHYADVRKAEPVIKIDVTRSNDNIKINVFDNGIGIEKVHLPKIFEMFYRGVEASKGTGIGLFLVKESLKMLHGKISVKSVHKEWTMFSLTIPNLHSQNENVFETEAVIYEDSV